MKSKIENKESWEERFYKRFISQETGVVDRNTFLLLNATIANLIDFIRKEKEESYKKGILEINPYLIAETV